MSLDQTTLNGTLRQAGGKGEARRLRVAGKIPAVIYGRTTKPVSVAVDPVELKKAIATPHKFNTVITVKLAEGDKLVLLKDYQQHPLNRALLHADFQEVRLDEALSVDAPIVLVGKAQGVADGGLLSQIKRTIGITCLPGQIPATIEVDVTGMKFGSSLHEKDVKLPEGVKLSGNKNETIATISVPEEAPAAAAGAAAAPAAGAKAAAPAAGGKAAPAAAAAKAPAKK
jgi:large subunit ribosomal protein L25